MNTHYMQSLDWIILAIYFVILLAIGIWASSKRKKEGSPISRRALPALAPYRFLHVGHQCWSVDVDSLSIGRIHDRYRQW